MKELLTYSSMLIGKRIVLRMATKSGADRLLGWYCDPKLWGDHYYI